MDQDGILLACYDTYISTLPDTPAKRQGYLCTNKGNAQFAMTFCSTKWLEDVPVGDRVVKNLQALANYLHAEATFQRANHLVVSLISISRKNQDPLILSYCILCWYKQGIFVLTFLE